MDNELDKIELNFDDIMKIKSDTRNKQVKAVYHSSPKELEKTGNDIRNIWKSLSTKLVRPKIF